MSLCRVAISSSWRAIRYHPPTIPTNSSLTHPPQQNEQIRALAIRTLARTVGQAPARLLPLVRAVWVDLLDTVMTAMGGWVRASSSAASSSATTASSSSGGAGDGGRTTAGLSKGKGHLPPAADSEQRAAAAVASSKAVEEPMRLLLALVRALRPRALLRPYVRRFVQQISYLLLADATAVLQRAPMPAAAAERGRVGSVGVSSSSSSSASPPLLEGESLTAALAVVGELAVISPEDLRPYVDLLMPRCVW